MITGNKKKTLRLATLLKKEALAQVLFCEFCESFKNTFLQNTTGNCFWKAIYSLSKNKNVSHLSLVEAIANFKLTVRPSVLSKKIQYL